MAQSSVLLTYHEIMTQLIELCQQQATGTVLICTMRNQAISFILQQGKIIGCFFEHQRGLAALKRIKNITTGTYTFCQNVFFSYQSDEVKTLSIQELFNYLNIEYSGDEKFTKLYRGATVVANEKNEKKAIEKHIRIYRGVIITDDNDS